MRWDCKVHLLRSTFRRKYCALCIPALLTTNNANLFSWCLTNSYFDKLSSDSGRVPTDPPFTAHIGGLPSSVERDDILEFFENKGVWPWKCLSTAVCLFVCLFVCFSPRKLTSMFFFVISLDFVEQDFSFYAVTRWHHRTLLVIIMCNGHMH